MKICMLTTAHSPLDDRIFYKETISLKKISSDIVVIAPFDKETYEENGIRIVGVKRSKTLYERYKLVDKVIEKAIEEKADVYHFHDFEILLKVFKIKKYLPNSKIIYDVHEYYPDMIRMSKKIPAFLKPFGTIYVNKIEERAARRFDYIITTDDYNKDRFRKLNKNVDVIYNFSEFTIKENVNITKEYDVIYQGGISVERGAINLVKAISIAQKKKEDIKMIFVGTFDDAETENSVLNYIKENKLENNIKYLGRVHHNEVENYIRKSRMGVVAFLPFPRYAKNIPIKQFEYMSCGIPVIGGYLPSVKRFVIAYNSGIIVDPTSPEDIANAILKILNNPNLEYELGQNGVRAVNEEYNWGNMENKLLGIYKKLQ